MRRVDPSKDWTAPPDAPEGCWPWWSVELDSGELVEVVGIGPGGGTSAAARVAPDGPWLLANRPELAVANVLRISPEDATELFWANAD
jgi:hypothetical protein